MKFGILTYTSLHCNFTNYGTVLQAWALQQTIRRLLLQSPDSFNDQVVLINYCPAKMEGMDPLAPFDNMWDNDERLIEQARKTTGYKREFKKNRRLLYQQLQYHRKGIFL